MPTKPLTDAEIDGLRRWAAGFPFGDLTGAAVLRLLDEVTRARALLRRIEWSAGPAGWTCPACDTFVKDREHEKHAPGCELAALIGK